MTHPLNKSSRRTAQARAFQNTLWSRVLLAGGLDSAQSGQAINELCRTYWYPIYAFVRRTEQDRQRARDLTQGFFQFVLEHHLLGRADPERGRFRSFLIGILKNYVRGEYDKQQALRRGGGAEIVSIDEEVAEGRYAHEPSTVLSPEKLFDRHWALLVLEQAMERLQSEYVRSGMKDLFAELQPYLTGEGASGFADLGGRLQRSEGAARVLVFRLKERFRQLIRAVIADTVSDLDQVEIEFKHLQAALREN